MSTVISSVAAPSSPVRRALPAGLALEERGLAQPWKMLLMDLSVQSAHPLGAHAAG